MSYAVGHKRTDGVGLNRLYPEDRPVHEWYRFVLSYPPHVVRTYLERFGVAPGQRVLDPFCGTGTTVVECRKRGVESVGFEANPVAHFAATVKLDWTPDPDALVAHAEAVAAEAHLTLALDGVEDEPFFSDARRPIPLRTTAPEKAPLLLADSLSPRPFHKALVLLDALARHTDARFSDHERLAFAKSIVHSSSNLRFGPEVGLGKIREDAAVVAPWLAGVRAMADDLRHVEGDAPTRVHLADARHAAHLLEPGSIDAVITSPPYPNEKDYTRTTRLESVLLGFTNSKEELRALKRGLVRSNTRGVYRQDEDDLSVEDHPEISRLSAEIEARRLELGKTSGFERLYARVTRLYFGGMYRHLADLRPALRPGAHLAYVVGDQASYFRILIRTGTILADLAQTLGYEVTGLDLFRTRAATATRAQLREEVLVLRWPG